ncbi:MAG: hypothetical protein BWY74_00903 [Firmicutes bacterium ADurb.Bin419]|nr:MAG: hypothetical protein BWY74_00903 [Firmicutes bacterium ADurb.Bin419]
MNVSANYNNILDKLDCYVSRITAISVFKGRSLSKREYF